MKKIIFGFILMAFTALLNAQPYHPMLEGENKWILGYNQNNMVCLGNIIELKDTLINFRPYSKIYTHKRFAYNDIDTSFYFIREDTAGKKIWLLNYDLISERILYDFSLNTGDSIYLTFGDTVWDLNPLYKTGYYKVDSVVYKNTLAGSRKTLYLRNHHNVEKVVLKWTEGVGSQISPVYLQELKRYTQVNFSCPEQDSSDEKLLCLLLGMKFMNGNLVFVDSCWIFNYYDDFYDTCNFASISKYQESDITAISIQPNPFSDIGTVIAKDGVLISSYEIYNIYGEVLKSEFYLKKQNIELNKTDFKEGMYFIKLYLDNKKTYVIKFIIY